ncbi:hypothetical protein DENIS_1409 [Desulfonema ishimotonii]|uniref:Uncharacterized protein n=1 Tax=Desulfonema ishimotonii TaxID=45657 RepID=A0A401FU08_9BACT|nr:hypothetical protein [Desulfonema ishimotonii]GBC60456.1 hypothetical protein DENIS_1409 [Desulfonema ishimotonii]
MCPALKKKDFATAVMALRAVQIIKGDIAAASKEQAQGIEAIHRAMSEIDKITRQTALDAEASAFASEAMDRGKACKKAVRPHRRTTRPSEKRRVKF